MSLAINNLYLLGIGAGLLAAIFFGAGDYYVGDVASKSSVFASTAVAYIFEFLLMGSLLIFQNDYGTTSENTKTLLIAICGNLGFLAFVFGLAKGKISIVAPLAAVLQLVVPLVLSIFVDDKTLSFLTWLGIAVSVFAIVFISLSKDDSTPKKSTLLSIFAGTASGLFFSLWLTGLTKVDTPIIMRVFLLSVPATIAAVIYLSVKRKTIAPVLKHIHVIAISSTGYMIGIYLFDFAESRVSLLISTLLIGLVPGVTIVLAHFKKNELISKYQYFGFFLAVLGIATIALGA